MRLEHLLSGARRRSVRETGSHSAGTEAIDTTGAFGSCYSHSIAFGGLAQLARAPALQAGGQRFESVILHSRVRINDRRSQSLKILHIGKVNIDMLEASKDSEMKIYTSKSKNQDKHNERICILRDAMQ